MAVVAHPDWSMPVAAPEPRQPRARTLHDDLVERGARWLRSKGCPMVLAEFRALTMECPDVLGWRERGSFLIECKASRADYFADRTKPFRVDPTQGVGNFRYYLTPPGLIARQELPPGWGLLYAHPARVEIVEGFDPKKCAPDPYYRFDSNMRAERVFLLSALRRLQLHHGATEFDRLVAATYASKHTKEPTA